MQNFLHCFFEKTTVLHTYGTLNFFGIFNSRLPLENMIEGLVTQEPQTCDSFFSTEITDHLFQKNK